MTGDSASDGGLSVLGIDVAEAELMQWLEWAMPVEQPYVMERDVARRLGLVDDPERLTQELQGTFFMYGVDDLAMCWLTREQAKNLPREVLKAQPARHMWRSGKEPEAIARDVDRVVHYVCDGRRTSRHAEVDATTWKTIETVLPQARRLAGTFPGRSGPNCFATVMAAAGVDGAENVWMQREPIEARLAENTVVLPARSTDDGVGVVYVWRRPDCLIDHTALALGQGYALHKPSDGWMSPTKVLTTRELMASARVPGRRLRRHRLN